MLTRCKNSMHTLSGWHSKALLLYSRFISSTTHIYQNYDGRPINNFQNGIILLIFKIWKIRYARFLGNLILNISRQFYYNDVTMMSVINIIFGHTAAQNIHKEQRSVTRFLWPIRLSINAIHIKMHKMYGDKCFTWPTIHVWCKKFADGQKMLLMRTN